MSNKEEREQISRNIEAMKAAPIVLDSLINYLVDEGIITETKLLEWIKKDKRVKDE
jgi:hypothetical protein